LGHGLAPVIERFREVHKRFRQRSSLGSWNLPEIFTTPHSLENLLRKPIAAQVDLIVKRLLVNTEG
jgi:hypothetical protein